MSKIFLIMLIFCCSLSSYSQCLKADIIFLLDWSGSENGNGVYISESTKDFIHSLDMGPSSVKVGIIPFDDDPKTSWCVPLTYDVDVLSNVVSNLGTTFPSGSTSYYGAFFLASSFFKESQEKRGESVINIIILISDGIETDFNSDEIIDNIKSYCLIWSLGTTSSGMTSFGRKRLNDICTSPEFYSEQTYSDLKEELLRLNICP